MAKKGGVYRRSRTDRYGHPKTGGMHLASYGLMDYAVSQNILGVLQMSPRAIANKCGAMPVSAVIRAIGELTSTTREIARWWPDLEVLWIVEALDEQSDGGKMDVSAARFLTTLPAEVQAAIRDRYGDRLSGTVPHTASDTSVDGLNSQRTESREQETPKAPKGARRRPAKQVDERAARVLDRVDEHRVRLGLAPMGEGRTETTVLARLRDGVTVDKLIAVVDAFGRLADREPDKRTVLCATTPFTAPRGDKPGGFAWGLSLLDRESAAPPKPAQGALLHISEIMARDAEEDTRATR